MKIALINSCGYISNEKNNKAIRELIDSITNIKVEVQMNKFYETKTSDFIPISFENTYIFTEYEKINNFLVSTTKKI